MPPSLHGRKQDWNDPDALDTIHVLPDLKINVLREGWIARTMRGEDPHDWAFFQLWKPIDGRTTWNTIVLDWTTTPHTDSFAKNRLLGHALKEFDAYPHVRAELEELAREECPDG
jgi:hypothetical protein